MLRNAQMLLGEVAYLIHWLNCPISSKLLQCVETQDSVVTRVSSILWVIQLLLGKENKPILMNPSSCCVFSNGGRVCVRSSSFFLRVCVCVCVALQFRRWAAPRRIHRPLVVPHALTLICRSSNRNLYIQKTTNKNQCKIIKMYHYIKTKNRQKKRMNCYELEQWISILLFLVWWFRLICLSILLLFCPKALICF